MLHLKLTQALLGLFAELLAPVVRAAALERARRINAAAPTFDARNLFDLQVETRHASPTVLEAISRPGTDWVQEMIRTMRIETVELGEMEARKIRASHRIADRDKADRLVRSVLPTVCGLALRFSDEFENDLGLALSAFYAEAKLAVMRFDPDKAGRTPFAAFVEDSLRLRAFALIDENANGGRKNREHEKALHSRLEELGMEGETDAAKIFAAFKEAYSLSPETDGEKDPLPKCLGSIDKIQVILDMRVAFGNRGEFRSLDAQLGDEDGQTLLDLYGVEDDLRLREEVDEIDVPEDSKEQEAEEAEVADIVAAIEAADVEIWEITALKGKLSRFLESAAEKSAAYHDPVWGAVIARAIGYQQYLTEIGQELAEELGIRKEVAAVLIQNVFPYYQGKLSA